MKVREVRIEGNDGVHEWGVTIYEDGTRMRWMENLAARREFERLYPSLPTKEGNQFK